MLVDHTRCPKATASGAGHTVRLTIWADGKGRVHFPDDVMRIDLLRHSPQGWANVGLIPA